MLESCTLLPTLFEGKFVFVLIKLFFSVDQDKQSNIEKKIISRKSWFVRNYYKCYPLFSIIVFKRLLRRTIPLSV